MMNLVTFIAPYCENYTSRALCKDCTKDMSNKYVFNCRLNESSVGISLILSGRLFQAVDPATQKARSPNLVQDDRLGTASLTPDFDADRSVDHLSLMTSGKQRSAMQPGAIPWSVLKTVMQSPLWTAKPVKTITEIKCDMREPRCSKH